MAASGLAGIDSFKAAKDAHLRLMKSAMMSAIDDAADMVLAEMEELTALTDHTLDDLRRMGHPYRRRAPQGVPHNDWLVHNQSGDLVEGLSRKPLVVKKGSIEVAITSRSKHTWYLLLGTRKMRPRDFVSAAMIIREDEVERIIGRMFMTALGGDPIRSPLMWKHIPHTTYPAQLPGDF
jgi:hypothetical protein